MTEQDDYLWSGEGAVDDPFVTELEARLAPLDDADELLAGIDLDGLLTKADARVAEAFAEQLQIAPPASPDAAQARDKVVQLRPLERQAPAQRSRAATWGWLAAAVAVLGLSVAVLAGEHQARLSAQESAEITGAAGAPRVIIDALPHVTEALRSACVTPPTTAAEPMPGCKPKAVHPGLSRCALALPPGSSASFELRLHEGVEQIEASQAEPATRACVEAAIGGVALGFGAEQRARIELRGPAAGE